MHINKDRKCYTDDPHITEGILRELIETSKTCESLDELIDSMTEFANELTMKRAREWQDFDLMRGRDVSLNDALACMIAHDPYYLELYDE